MIIGDCPCVIGLEAFSIWSRPRWHGIAPIDARENSQLLSQCATQLRTS